MGVSMTKEITIEQLEIELEKVKTDFDAVYQRVRENRGSKILIRLMELRSRIFILKRNIDNIKKNRTRSNKKSVQEKAVGMKIGKIEQLIKQEV